MRKLLLGLVLLNIVFLSAHWWSSSAVVAGENVDSQSSQAIHMLSESLPADSSLAPNSEPMCVRIGPFDQLLHAEYLQEAMMTLGVSGVLQRMVTSESIGYRVDVEKEDAGNVVGGLALMQELQNAGILSFIVDGSEAQVSLGVFGSEAEARAAIAALPINEYSTSIEPHNTADDADWVVLAAQESAKLSKKQWLELLNAFPNAEKQLFFCLGVASL